MTEEELQKWLGPDWYLIAPVFEGPLPEGWASGTCEITYAEAEE